MRFCQKRLTELQNRRQASRYLYYLATPPSVTETVLDAMNRDALKPPRHGGQLSEL